MTQLLTPKKMRGPFKPAVGLSGVVAYPTLRPVPLGAQPRDLQFFDSTSEFLGQQLGLLILSRVQKHGIDEAEHHDR
jgi:hypothetical protein